MIFGFIKVFSSISIKYIQILKVWKMQGVIHMMALEKHIQLTFVAITLVPTVLVVSVKTSFTVNILADTA